MESLDFSGREQLYYQLYNILFKRITDGVYKEGECIPSENELVNRYHVSRMTARKSMEMLVSQGMVVKKRGIGTVVISSHPNSSPQKLVSYSKKTADDKLSTYKVVTSLETVAASKEVAISLQIEEADKVIRLRRICMTDETPLFLETHYFEHAAFPDLVNHDFSKESLRAYLTNSCYVNWAHAKQQVFSILADSESAKLLTIKSGAPLLHVKRISYDTQDMPREYVETSYRSDKYHIEIKLAI